MEEKQKSAMFGLPPKFSVTLGVLIALVFLSCRAPLPSQMAIIGGKEVDRPPYFLSLFARGSEGSYEGVCGSVYLGGSWALSAAHCVLGQTDLRVSWAEHSKDVTGEGALVQAIIIHPEYHPDHKKNDIALIRLDQDLQRDAQLQPIRIGQDVKAGDVIQVVGRGNLTTHGVMIKEDSIHAIDLPVLSPEVCLQRWQGVMDQDRQFCAAPSPTEGGMDSCQGDSGGPAVMATEEPLLVGLVGFGYPCAQPGSPGVYTKTAPYRSWVEEAIAHYQSGRLSLAELIRYHCPKRGVFEAFPLTDSTFPEQKKARVSFDLDEGLRQEGGEKPDGLRPLEGDCQRVFYLDEWVDLVYERSAVNDLYISRGGRGGEFFKIRKALPKTIEVFLGGQSIATQRKHEGGWLGANLVLTKEGSERFFKMVYNERPEAQMRLSSFSGEGYQIFIGALPHENRIFQEVRFQEQVFFSQLFEETLPPHQKARPLAKPILKVVAIKNSIAELVINLSSQDHHLYSWQLTCEEAFAIKVGPEEIWHFSQKEADSLRYSYGREHPGAPFSVIKSRDTLSLFLRPLHPFVEPLSCELNQTGEVLVGPFKKGNRLE